MSISNLLDQSIKPWCNLEINDLVVDGSFTSSGAIISSGNILVQNADPSISIVNNTANSNAAKLSIQGATGLSPIVLQQEANGDLLLLGQNNSSIGIRSSGSGNISLFPQGSGSVLLAGSQYASKTGNLRLSGGNPNNILATSIGTVTQGTNISTAVTLNTPNGIITTQTADAATGVGENQFVFNNSSLISSSGILLSINQYPGTGLPVLNAENLVAGACTIHIKNASVVDTLNAPLNIAYSVIN
jgi:hypothetical protein